MVMMSAVLCHGIRLLERFPVAYATPLAMGCLTPCSLALKRSASKWEPLYSEDRRDEPPPSSEHDTSLPYSDEGLLMRGLGLIELATELWHHNAH
jgi:hypothetical protein